MEVGGRSLAGAGRVWIGLLATADAIALGDWLTLADFTS